MCGRFVSSTPASKLAEQFMAEEVATAEKDPAYNVAPTDEVYAVVARRGVRRLGTLRWGLVPSWSKDASTGNRMINLRADTVSEKPSFRRMLENRRCVIPADGFYEWKAMGKGRRKQPFFIRSRDGRPLALAGLWQAWKDHHEQDTAPGGVGDPAAARRRGWGPAGEEEAEQWLRTCTVLTTEPNELVAPVHDRMPAILAPDDVETWLDEGVTDPDVLVRLLRPYPPELLEMWPVTTAVNDVKNDGPRLVEPLEGHEPAEDEPG